MRVDAINPLWSMLAFSVLGALSGWGLLGITDVMVVMVLVISCAGLGGLLSLMELMRRGIVDHPIFRRSAMALLLGAVSGAIFAVLTISVFPDPSGNLLLVGAAIAVISLWLGVILTVSAVVYMFRAQRQE